MINQSDSIQLIGKTSRDYSIWRIPNKAGGHQYITDSCGIEAVFWDTSIASTEELEMALNYEKTSEEGSNIQDAFQELYKVFKKYPEIFSIWTETRSKWGIRIEIKAYNK